MMIFGKVEISGFGRGLGPGPCEKRWIGIGMIEMEGCVHCFGRK